MNNNLLNSHFILEEVSDALIIKKYKTGDFARILNDGNIEFIGRKDSQLKINGYRINISAVENIFFTHEKVLHVYGLVLEEHETKQFILFLQLGHDINLEEVINYVQKKLPKYMLRKHVFQIDQIPLNANGKVNRQELVTIAKNKIKAFSDTSMLTVINTDSITLQELIDLVSNVWSRVIGVEITDLNTNFFELGGTSFAAIKVARLLGQSLGKVSVVEIFKFPTVMSFCENYFKQKNEIIETNSEIINKNDINERSALAKLRMASRIHK